MPQRVQSAESTSASSGVKAIASTGQFCAQSAHPMQRDVTRHNQRAAFTLADAAHASYSARK